MKRVVPIAATVVVIALCGFLLLTKFDTNRSTYKTNESGQTYGSYALEYDNQNLVVQPNEMFELYPDLIAVENHLGVEGYVYKEDFLGPFPSSPEEAVAMTESGAFGPREVTMYAEDGKTVLGTFWVNNG